MARILASISCLFLSATLIAGVEHIITSDRTTDWGLWGSLSRCPSGSFANSWIQRVEPNQGLFEDDTALNAIQMNCVSASNPSNQTGTIASTIGPWGTWGSLYSCVPGFIQGFNLKVEEYLGSGDDTASNSLRAICSDGKTVEATGGIWGQWRTEKYCDFRHAACGLQTQVEPDQGDDDDTSLNNINILCCPLPNLAETCVPLEIYRTAIVCDNTHSTTASECVYSYDVGVGYAPGSEKTAMGWEGVGFTLKDAVKDLPATFKKNLNTEKSKCAFHDTIFAPPTTVSNVVIVPAGVKSTINYLAADCAHYSVSSRSLKRVDISKAGKVVAETHFDI